MRTKLKKALVILMVLIIIMQICTTSFAGLNIGEKVNLKSKGRLDCLLQYYKNSISSWSYKIAYYIYYIDKETGKKIPALCVEPTREGVGESGSYDGTINICKDDGIYTILYLYNNKKYTDWGLNSEDDYYLAVQTAMHCYSEKINPKTKYRVGDKVLAGYTPSTLDEIKKRGTVVLNTAESLYNSAIKKEYKQQNLTVGLEEKSDWIEEDINGKEFYSKKYEVKSNVNLEYYQIDTSKFYKNVKIFDMKNNELKGNVGDKNFKIAILKSEISNPKTIKGTIEINSATAKLPAAVYANSNNSNKQNYVVYTDTIKQVSTTQETQLTTKNNIIIINKLDNENKLPLEGAQFGIYKNKKDEKGKYILNKETYIFTTEVSNSNGEIILKIDEPGEYIAIEKKAPNGYLISEEAYQFSVDIGISPKDKEINICNDIIKGKIEILKISKDYNKYLDIKAGTALEGAKYLIEDSNGRAVGIYTTDSNGKILTDKLPYGEYKIYEIESPKYYNVNKEPKTIFINESERTYSVTFENETSKVDLNIEKTGIKETESGKIVEYEFNNLENKSNVYVDNFIWRDMLPTDAVRLKEISTGTWNNEVNYSIWYKTNLKNEYVMYKENLNSKKNYTLKINDLKLADNEYITEYEFRFGTVAPGFKEEKNPKIICKVLDNLKDGYEFTNNTYLTANYLEEKIEKKDNWKTVVYNKKTPTTVKLPKTGA